MEDINTKPRRYFTGKQIYLATALGGPIPAGFMIFTNLNKIGEKQYAKVALFSAIVYLAILLYGIFLIPDDIYEKLPRPNIIMPLITAAFVFLIYHNGIEKIVKQNLGDNIKRASGWPVAGYTVLGLVLSVALIFFVGYFSPFFPGEKVQVGDIHEIYYDEEDISDNDIQITAQLLTDIGYFSDDYAQSVRLEKEDVHYNLIIPFPKEYWDDQAVSNDLQNIKLYLSEQTSKDFQIVLIYWDLGGNTFKKVF